MIAGCENAARIVQNICLAHESGQPAPFSADALSLFLSPAGVAQVVYNAYVKDCAAKEKN